MKTSMSGNKGAGSVDKSPTERPDGDHPGLKHGRYLGLGAPNVNVSSGLLDWSRLWMQDM
jgi:hypothetical protein